MGLLFLLLGSCSPPRGCLSLKGELTHDACNPPRALVAAPGLPRILFYNANPLTRRQGELVPRLAAQLALRGLRAEWIGAGSPHYGFFEAEAELPDLVDVYKPAAVIVFASQSALLDTYFFRSSRSAGPLLEDLLYESLKWKAFSFSFRANFSQMKAAIGQSVAALARLQEALRRKGVALFVLSDGNVRQSPGSPGLCRLRDPLCPLTGAFFKTKTEVGAEFLVPAAITAGIPFRTEPVLADALRSDHPNQEFIASLMAITITPHLTALVNTGGLR